MYYAWLRQTRGIVAGHGVGYSSPEEPTSVVTVTSGTPRKAPFGLVRERLDGVLIAGASRTFICIRSGCCARATSGHAAAAPPSSVMKSRRFTSSMRLPLPENPLRYRCPSLPHPQPAAERWTSPWGLNRSEIEVAAAGQSSSATGAGGTRWDPLHIRRDGLDRPRRGSFILGVGGGVLSDQTYAQRGDATRLCAQRPQPLAVAQIVIANSQAEEFVSFSSRSTASMRAAPMSLCVPFGPPMLSILSRSEFIVHVRVHSFCSRTSPDSLSIASISARP